MVPAGPVAFSLGHIPDATRRKLNHSLKQTALLAASLRSPLQDKQNDVEISTAFEIFQSDRLFYNVHSSCFVFPFGVAYLVPLHQLLLPAASSFFLSRARRSERSIKHTE